MAKFKYKLTKDEYAKLDDSSKENYVASGDDFVLDAEGVEDVTGLKNKNTELLKDKKTLTDLLKKFEGLDADEARKALEEMADIEAKKLADKGEYETLLTKHKTDFETKLKAATDSQAKTIANLKREKLTNFLVANGVIADRAGYALSDVDALVDLADGENGFELKGKDGAELAQIVGDLKTKSGFLFAASGASGSGASGSDGNGAAVKTMTRAAFDQLTPGEQSQFSIGGGELTD